MEMSGLGLLYGKMENQSLQGEHFLCENLMFRMFSALIASHTNVIGFDRFEEVMIVTLRYRFDGYLLLTTEGLYFRQIGNGANVISKESCPLPRSDRRWRLNGLKEVHGRRYLLRTQALELFFADGQELFLNFTKGQKERNRFYAKVRNSCKVSYRLETKSILRHQLS